MHPTRRRAVLFDLDGTLVDTASELAQALRGALGVDAAMLGDDVVHTWIGNGARALVASGWHWRHPTRRTDAAGLASTWDAFAQRYEAVCGTTATVHAGARESLAALRADGIALALVTNKEARFTQPLLARLGLAAAFDVVVCGDTLAVRKPDPAVAHHALRRVGADARDAVLVGDSLTDVRTARAAAMAVLLVRHGHGAPVPGSIDAPDGWLDTLDALPRSLQPWWHAADPGALRRPAGTAPGR